MTKKIFIVNPQSGNGAGKNNGEKLEQLLPKLNVDYEIIYTKYPRHASEIAAQYTVEDHCDLIAVGGDGTLNEVLNGVQKGVTMGLLPSGSGNDFYRLIDPKLVSFQEMVESILEGEKIQIDYGVMNGHKFLGSFSVGMDASVAERAAKIQEKNKGVRRSAYLRAIVGELFSEHGFDVCMEMEQQTIHKRVLLVSALNGRFYGGGFKPAPFADIQDGLFDVALVDTLPVWRMIQLLPKYMAGKHSGLKEIISLKTNHLTLKSDKEMIAQCDGELFRSHEIDLQMYAKGLNFIMPRGTKYEYRK